MTSVRKQVRFVGALRGRDHLAGNSKMCSYRDFDGACGNLKVLLSKDGLLHESPFCKQHCCRKVTGQTACHRTRYPQMHFCQERESFFPPTTVGVRPRGCRRISTTEAEETERSLESLGVQTFGVPAR